METSTETASWSTQVRAVYRAVGRNLWRLAKVVLIYNVPRAFLDILVLLTLSAVEVSAASMSGVFIGMQALLLPVDALGYAALVAACRSYCVGEDYGIRSAYTAARSDFLRVFATGVLAWLAIVLSLAALVVPGVYVATRVQLFAVVVLSEACWLTTALRRSWELTANNVVAKLLATVVSNVPLVVYLGVRIGITVNAGSNSTSFNMLLCVVQLFVSVFAVPLSAMCAAILYTGATQGGDARYSLLSPHSAPADGDADL